MPVELQRVKQVFLAAVEKSDRGARETFLQEACSGDDGLRRQVEALLAQHERAGGFLDSPPAGVPEMNGPYAVTASEVAPQEAVGSRIGPYKLLQQLGEGGMGTVYLAEQEEPVKRRVALKIIKAGMDSARVVARFEAERQALAMMDHPHIARVLDGGSTHNGRPFFVMDLVKGIPITTYCDQEHLTLRERLELFIPVCQAVQHAHQKGIIHRDLKPSNVFIALYDGKPVPKVIDFGLAKATAQNLTERTMFTEVGQMVGTLEYMAPEQAELNNLDIDTRADIYSLGVILYELLTGSPPFTARQLRSAAFTEMLRMIREVEPPRPSTKLSSSIELPSIAANRKLEPARLTRLVHGDLDWIAMKCLAKERNRRYETANGLALDIQRYLADEPVLAGPPSVGYRLRKFVQRNRGRVVAAVLMLCALIAGMIGTSVGLFRAREAEQKAKERLTESRAAQTKAVARFRLAREAVDSFQTRVSENPELKAHSLERLRTRLLESASDFYEKFVKEQDDDPEIRAELGRAYYRLGKLYIDTAQFHDGTKAYEAAIAIQKQLSEAFPREAQYRRDLGKSLNDLGEAKMTDSTSPAVVESLLRQALVIREALAEEDALNPQSQYDLAETCNNLGVFNSVSNDEQKQFRSRALDLMRSVVAGHPDVAQFQDMLGNVCNNCAWYADSPAAALPFQEESAEILKKLVADHPENTEYGDSLGAALLNLARWNGALGQADSAEQNYKDSMAVWRKLVASHPLVPGFLRGLAVVDSFAGSFYFDARRYREAEDVWQEGVKALERLSESSPELATLPSEFLRCHEGLAKIYRLTGRTDLAETTWKKYVADCRDRANTHPKHTGIQSALGDALRAQGELHEAILPYRTAIELDPTNISARWGLESVYSTLGERRLQKGDLEGLQEHYENNFEIWKECVTANPDSTEARIGLAAAHRWLTFSRLATGEVQAAAEESRQAVELMPEDSANWGVYAPALLLAGDIEGHRQFCAGLLERFGETEDPDIAFHVCRACGLVPLAASEAVRVMQLAKRAPSEKRHPWYPHGLGLACFRTGDFDQAIERLQESLAVDPGWHGTIDNWLVLSMAHLRRGQIEEAGKWLYKATQYIGENSPIRRPEYLGPFARLHSHDWLEGRVLHREAKRLFDEVVSEYRKAVESNPADAAAYWRLANTLQHRRDCDALTAGTLLRAAELRPDDVGFWYLAAQAHLSAGDAEGFRRVCARMLKLFGQTGDPNIAGRLLYAFLPVKDALDDMAALVALGELAGTQSGNARVLGGALYRAGSYEAAIPRLEEGQARAWDHLFLAMAHHRLGHADKAREYLQKASSQVTTDAYPWPENVEAECLLREARELIK
jgi:serine/threonine protein kinase/Flp pilus assembly protein TadD